MSKKVISPVGPKSRPDTGPTAGRARDPEPEAQRRPPEELLHELQAYRVELEMQNETLRQAQAELEESRDRYADLYEFAPIGYLTLDNQGLITEINITGAELLGADRGGLLQRPFAVFVTPEDRGRWRQHLVLALRHGAKQSCELGLLHGTGGSFIACLEYLRSGVGGKSPTLRVAMTDITARWRAEQALLESETRFRNMADAAPVLIWVAGIDRGRNWFNQQWLRFTGRGLADEMGVGWTRRVHGDDLQRCLNTYNEAFDRRQSFDMEYRLRRADGQYRWIFDNSVPRYGPDQEFLGYIGSCVDITRMKHVSDDLLNESKERFCAFMINSPVASWIMDAEGRFQYVSLTYYKTFKVLATDLVGKLIGEVYPAPLAERHLRSIQDVIAAWRPIESMQLDVRADGSDGEFLVVNFPIRDAGGRPLVCAMALDITERRQAVVQLRDANQRLEQLAVQQAAHLRELARDLTHTEQRERDRLYELLHDDVQPLLVAARLSLSGLDSRTSPQDRLRGAVEACQHIGGVIDVTRTLSVQLSPPLIRERGLNAALESLCRWVRDNHGLEVELNSMPEADPDDMALRLLCFNAVRELLTNTVKHAGTSRANLALDLVDGETLRITVADRGGGFDPATISNGSGLSAIRRRLSMLGGSLQIESRPGQGTTATLAAPLRSLAAGSSARGAGDRRGKPGGQNAQNIDSR